MLVSMSGFWSRWVIVWALVCALVFSISVPRVDAIAPIILGAAVESGLAEEAGVALAEAVGYRFASSAAARKFTEAVASRVGNVIYLKSAAEAATVDSAIPNWLRLILPASFIAAFIPAANDVYQASISGQPVDRNVDVSSGDQVQSDDTVTGVDGFQLQHNPPGKTGWYLVTPNGTSFTLWSSDYAWGNTANVLTASIVGLATLNGHEYVEVKQYGKNYYGTGQDYLMYRWYRDDGYQLQAVSNPDQVPGDPSYNYAVPTRTTATSQVVSSPITGVSYVAPSTQIDTTKDLEISMPNPSYVPDPIGTVVTNPSQVSPQSTEPAPQPGTQSAPQPAPAPSPWSTPAPNPSTQEAPIPDDIISDIRDFFDLSKPINWEPMKRIPFVATTRFPLSLPWDLQRAVSSLQAPASLPSFHGVFWGPVQNVPLDINWPDWMSQFVPLVRYGLFFIFNVGLIFAVSRLFRGAS